MMAAWFDAARLKLDQEESERLAAAIKDVARHYEFAWLDDRTTDWINLFQVAGGVYGPRVVAWWFQARTPSHAESPIRPGPSSPAGAAAGLAPVAPVPVPPAMVPAGPASGKVIKMPGVVEVEIAPGQIVKMENPFPFAQG